MGILTWINIKKEEPTQDLRLGHVHQYDSYLYPPLYHIETTVKTTSTINRLLSSFLYNTTIF